SVTSIGSYAFAYCSSLTSISIPNSVTSIGNGAFAYCSSLTSISIPNSVTSIGSWAFEYCSSLTSITFNGTKAQWNEIDKGSNWNRNVPATFVRCTDGDVNI
ncbi:MAG: leucine-rich repeat domain-containing protein, partial [Clostridia bacterium]|nr:leucine-rich repeat domain-containing protein [Clostridia bacterium]